jgi:hypothetical protein
MTQILPAGAVNTAALGAPKAVVAIQTPGRPIVAAPSNILSYIGVGSWGPVNVATVIGGKDQQVATFGPVTNRLRDLSSAVAIALLQLQSSFLNVRVTDTTDTAASGTYATSETAATETVAGTIHTGDVLTLTFTPTTGSPIVVTYALTASETTAALAAAKLLTALQANAALAAAGFAFSVLGAAVSIFCPGGVAPGTGWTSIAPSVTGGGATTTLTAGTSAASTVKLTLAGLYTGVVGNTLQPSVQPGTAANSVKLVISRPGFVSEVFDNITGAGNLLWVNLANAVNNGAGVLRGPSRLCLATAGPGGAAAPVSAAAVTMSGGTDGALGVTDAMLLGVDTTPRKGLYALRNLGVGVACPVDHSTTTHWTNFDAFGIAEQVFVHASSPSSDTLTAAASELATAGVDDWGLRVFFGDWLYWFDEDNGVQRLASPATFGAAQRALYSPQRSTLNKPYAGIVGSQKTLTGAAWSDPEKDAIFAARMDLISNPCPGGNYWGTNNGVNVSSNQAIFDDNYTMLTNFLARAFAGWVGSQIGKLQTPQQRANAKGAGDSFFNNLWKLGYIGNANSAFGKGAPPWSVAINDQTTPPDLAALGYEIAAIRVQYLSAIRWFVANLMGGKTVTVSVQNAPPSFAQNAG